MKKYLLSALLLVTAQAHSLSQEEWAVVNERVKAWRTTSYLPWRVVAKNVSSKSFGFSFEEKSPLYFRTKDGNSYKLLPTLPVIIKEQKPEAIFEGPQPEKTSRRFITPATDYDFLNGKIYSDNHKVTLVHDETFTEQNEVKKRSQVSTIYVSKARNVYRFSENVVYVVDGHNNLVECVKADSAPVVKNLETSKTLDTQKDSNKYYSFDQCIYAWANLADYQEGETIKNRCQVIKSLYAQKICKGQEFNTFKIVCFRLSFPICLMDECKLHCTKGIGLWRMAKDMAKACYQEITK